MILIRYDALSSGRSLQGNHDGAPCVWPATMTPSASSSQPMSSPPSGTGRGRPPYPMRRPEPLALGDRGRGPDEQLAPGLRELGHPVALDGHLGDLELVQVQTDQVEVGERDRFDDRASGQPVGLQACSRGPARSARRSRRGRRSPGSRSRAGATSGCGHDLLVVHPGADRVADPAGLVRHGLASHHQGHRADGSVPPEHGRGQDHAVGTERGTGPQRDGVHAQDAVVEQVGLHHAAGVHGHPVAQVHQVRLGQPVGLAPHALAHLGAHRAQPQVEHRQSPSRRVRTTGPRSPRRTCRPAR